MDTYPAKYTDKFGTEQTSIANDGKSLRMTVRGVEFVGSDFDGFERPEGVEAAILSQFSFCHTDLCSYRLECEIPLTVSDRNNPLLATLSVELILGDPDPGSKGGLDHAAFRLSLSCCSGEFASSGKSGYFEDEMLEIQAQLPEGVFIKSCINCLYSDYSPYGHGLFGGMICFRNKKAEYLNVKSKRDLLMLHDRSDPFVQETYVCPEFERRVPGTGYRG